MKKSVAVLIPCYKRPEYTKLCLEAVRDAQEYWDQVYFYIVDDGSLDETSEIIKGCGIECTHIKNSKNLGLRTTIIDFFQWVKDLNSENAIDYITKIDNDCLVPKNWLNDLLEIMEDSGADVLSPNVSETNAAYKYGKPDDREGAFIPSEIVGGVWTMKREMIEGIYFEKAGTSGIRGAFHIIQQIVIENDPKIGWTDKVTYEDVGHWLGTHPKHIKTRDHFEYSREVGRRIAWN